MDPNAALRLAKDGDRQAAKDLKNWVRNGGFEPDDPNWRDYV